jgi:hypothetical protein
MNNNLYHWHDERMVEFEMQEVNRAVEQARLLKEAGLSGANLLARVFAAVHNLLAARSNRLQDDRSIEHQSY